MRCLRHLIPVLALCVASPLVKNGDPDPAGPQLEARQLGGSATTRNDLVDGKCGSVVMVFARGTTEAGNVGQVAGPPFFDALAAKAPDLAVQGVDYAASIGGIVQGGDKAGTAKMVQLVQTAVQQCPDSAIVMAGYSQGAMLVHNAATQLGETAGSVKAAVTFGDPFQRTEMAGVQNQKVFCHVGDGICDGTFIITPAHLTYSQDAQAAADFVAQAVGL